MPAGGHATYTWPSRSADKRSMYIAPGQAEGAGARDGFQQVGVCIVPLALASLDHAEGEMRDPSAVDHPRAL